MCANRQPDLQALLPEARNPRSQHLDGCSSLEIVTLMNSEDRLVPDAITPELPQIAKVIDRVVMAFQQGKRLIYIGAGTSGRLGVLDASECPPTFGVPASQIVGLIAGGDAALRSSLEGAEDDTVAAVADLTNHNLTPKDVVIGIAASGQTPYVLQALSHAKQQGCFTAAITSNPYSALAKKADVAIAPLVGPEILTGSTRLKSGTAQKLILNMITTASLVLTGKAYQNLMVDVQTTNAKLKARALNMVMQITDCDRKQAEKILANAHGEVKLAIFMQLSGLDVKQARQRLSHCGGFLGQALQTLSQS